MKNGNTHKDNLVANLNDIKIMLMEAIWERICEKGQTESANDLNVFQSRISHLKNKQVDKFGITSLLLIAKDVGLELDVNVIETKGEIE